MLVHYQLSVLMPVLVHSPAAMDSQCDAEFLTRSRCGIELTCPSGEGRAGEGSRWVALLPCTNTKGAALIREIKRG